MTSTATCDHDQLPMWPVFTTAPYPELEHIDADSLLDAAQALGRVTLADYRQWTYSEPAVTPRPTIYQELVALPNGLGCVDLYDRRPGRETAPLSVIAKRGIDALTRAVKAAVEPGCDYAMPHSGGYDSRLLAAILDMVYDKPVAPVSWAPETEIAELLCSRSGWDVWSYRGGEDFFAPVLLDICELGRNVSDPSRWQGGRHWLISALKDIEPDGVISAAFADETMGWNIDGRTTIRDFIDHRLMDQHDPHGNWILPFASRPWLEDVLLRYHLTEKEPNRDEIRLYEWFSPGDTLKREMLRQIDPHLLDIPNPRFELAQRTRPPHNEVLPHTLLSEDTRAKMAEWYPDIEGPPPHAVTSTGPWLCEYTRRAMIEAAEDAGVEVRK